MSQEITVSSKFENGWINTIISTNNGKKMDITTYAPKPIYGGSVIETLTRENISFNKKGFITFSDDTGPRLDTEVFKGDSITIYETVRNVYPVSPTDLETSIKVMKITHEVHAMLVRSYLEKTQDKMRSMFGDLEFYQKPKKRNKHIDDIYLGSF